MVPGSQAKLVERVQNNLAGALTSVVRELHESRPKLPESGERIARSRVKGESCEAGDRGRRAPPHEVSSRHSPMLADDAVAQLSNATGPGRPSGRNRAIRSATAMRSPSDGPGRDTPPQFDPARRSAAAPSAQPAPTRPGKRQRSVCRCPLARTTGQSAPAQASMMSAPAPRPAPGSGAPRSVRLRRDAPERGRGSRAISTRHPTTASLAWASAGLNDLNAPPVARCPARRFGAGRRIPGFDARSRDDRPTAFRP